MCNITTRCLTRASVCPVTGRTTTAVSSTAEERTERCVAAAAHWLESGRRLDMQGLADELGLSRATLFRHVGGRETLIGHAYALLTRRLLDRALRRAERPGTSGDLRCARFGREMNRETVRDPGLRRLLADEPALTLRVLTDPRGPVQPLIVAFLTEVLRGDLEEHGLKATIEISSLAYALVRLGESFLYADALADRTPDLALANKLQAALLSGTTRSAGR